MIRSFLVFVLTAGFAVSSAAAADGRDGPFLGVNYNEHLEALDNRELDRLSARWLRGFLEMVQISPAGPADHIDIDRILKAGEDGYRTILSLKWRYRGRDFPALHSVRMSDEIMRVNAVLARVMGNVDILVIGNEPFIETDPEDMDATLNVFYEAMADHIIAWRAENCGIDCPTMLYMGAVNRLDLRERRIPALKRFLRYIHDQPAISGLDIHVHAPDLQASRTMVTYPLQFLRYDQRIVVTEFSLVWAFKKHNKDRIPEPFAEEYGYPKSMRVFEYLDRALNEKPVSRAEWVAFLSLSPWFEERKRNLREQFGILQDTGRLHVATYAMRQMWQGRRRYTPSTTPWVLNSLYAASSVRLNQDGVAEFNYAWADDFIAIQKQLTGNE